MEEPTETREGWRGDVGSTVSRFKAFTMCLHLSHLYELSLVNCSEAVKRCSALAKVAHLYMYDDVWVSEIDDREDGEHNCVREGTRKESVGGYP